MQKILILTTATGEGHNQAAKSLRDILKTEYSETLVFDFLENTKAVNDLVIGGYEIAAKIFPYIYGFFYKTSNFKAINRMLEFFLRAPMKATLEYINEFKPDVIACTHPLAVCILGCLSRKGLITAPMVCVTTDFKPHYTYYSSEIDAYITGSEYSKKTLNRFGIPNDKIHTVGIPVGENFYKRYETTKTNDEFCNVLVMGGSMGLSGISKVLEQIITNTNKLNITLVCGKNTELKNSLEQKYKDYINLKILGYVNTIPTLMDSMDLIITKPGGLTTTESIHKGLPMIIPFVIPGQETDNAKMLVTEGAAIRVKNIAKINGIIDDLIDNPENLKCLKENMIRLSKNYSIDGTRDIFDNLTNSSGLTQRGF